MLIIDEGIGDRSDLLTEPRLARINPGRLTGLVRVV
jgi:hypothetical protein